MFRKMVDTVVGGAIGVGALYLVGKICYNAGKEVGAEELRYEMYKNSRGIVLKNEPEELKEPPRRRKDSWLAKATKGLFGVEKPEITIRVNEAHN